METGQKNQSKKTEIKGQKSLEQLNHFRCGACKKWWSIGDCPKNKKDWFCPWCGCKQKM